MLTGARLAFDGCDAKVGSDDADLIEQLAHGKTGDYKTIVSLANKPIFGHLVPQFGCGDVLWVHFGPLYDCLKRSNRLH